MESNIRHRSGPLKQTNKSHKTGRHRSKGVIDNALKGRVPLTIVSHKQKVQQRKEQRRNQLKQVRKNKRQDVIEMKRRLGRDNVAPHLICILPLNLSINSNSALCLLKSCDETVEVHELTGITYINVPRLKQRFAFVMPPVGHGFETTILDYLKVCDTTLLLTSADAGEDLLDEWGEYILRMISAQGLPGPIVTLMDLLNVLPKKRQTTKADAVKCINNILPGEKVMPFDIASDCLNIFRRIAEQKKKLIINSANRPHLFGDIVKFMPNFDRPSNGLGCLLVTGYLRGTPLDVNGLVHITGLGDFQIKQIDKLKDPYKMDKLNNSREPDIVTLFPDPMKQTSLQCEHVPDVMDAEQTWPTEEEIKASQVETNTLKMVKRIPKGWSEYQAAWIPDDDANFFEDGESECESDNAVDNDVDDDFMSCKSEGSSDSDYEEPNDGTEETENLEIEMDAEKEAKKYDLEMDFQEERLALERFKQHVNNQQWPDEVETPLDTPARERFQKYRGLASFRTTPWDPKWNLPSDYARIYKFKNFELTKKRIIAQAKHIQGVMPGTYVTLHIANVVEQDWCDFTCGQGADNIALFGLLPNEHKMTVMHVVLKGLHDAPIKSKDELIVQCGYRRFLVNPVYSMHNNADKHMMERFFTPQTVVCASFYAPIQFPPAAVLAFVQDSHKLNLVARGFLLTCNPDRIILKRVVLSGHPKRIHRKTATIRYMFFNKEDVEYFQPIKLRTKCGFMGHIKQSLGTHGHMKCNFNGQLLSYDTVFMHLYKRVYPKWAYKEWKPICV